MKVTWLERIVFAGMLAMLLAIPANVQAQAVGTIVGVVKDASGGVVPGALITVTNTQTGFKRETTSNATGNYTVPALPPGRYNVQAEMQGFRKELIKEMDLQVDQTARLDISLTVGSPNETVEVRTEIPMLNTENPALGQVIDNKRLLELPLNGRQFLELALQVPGVVTGNGGPQTGDSTMFQRPGMNSSISVSGGRSQNNSYLLDGTQNTDPDVNAFVVSPSVDSVQEFKMETRNYSAEFGRSSGGQINVVTKSGTNQLHGSLYEFLRNDAVDARPFNNPGKLPKYRRNQFGATLGGPILRDRTFFFASYEGLRRVEGQSTSLTVPLMAQRTGDFTGTTAIYDPQTTRPDPTDPTGKRSIRTQFSGNIIPASRLNPIAFNILKDYVPAPNQPGTANNYLDTRSSRQRTNQESLRIDHRFSSKDMLFGRHIISNETSFVPSGLPGSGTYAYARAQNFTLSETHVFGPSLVNEAKFGFLRLRLERLSENAFKNDVVGKLGIQGVQFGGPQVWGIPSVTLTGFSAIGDDNFFLPMRLRNNTYQALDNLTWIRGKHTFKFGGELRLPYFSIIQIFTPRGDFRFNANFSTRTAGTVSPDATGSTIASFLLGLPYQQRRTIGVNPSYLSQISVGGYVQDDWKISPRLTMNIGMRYDLITPWVDKYDSLSTVSFLTLPTINEIAAKNLQGKYEVPIVLAGKNGTPRGLTTTDKNNFAPRFGFAFRPTSRNSLVIRAGYGLYYGATDGEHVGRMSLNAPFVISDTQDSDLFNPQINGIGFTYPPTIGGPLIQSFIGMAQNLRTPYTHQWNMAVQGEIFRKLTAEIAYVGSGSHKLDYRDAMNDANAGSGAVQARRLFQYMVLPQDLPANLPGPVVDRRISCSTLEIQTNRVNSNYHALQSKLERRVADGLSFMTSYTFSKTIADGNSYRRQGTQGELAQDFLNNHERGLTGYDIRQRFVTSTIYALPFGKGKKFDISNKLVDGFLGGWQMSGIFQGQTGFPFTVLLASASANNGRSTRPNAVAGQSTSLPADQRSLTNWMNAAAFVAPAPFTVGNSGVMTVTGPGLNTLDMSISKRIRIMESHSLQLRLDAFNFYNHPNWGPPGVSIGSATFNRISSQTVPPRQLQFSLKIIL